MPTDLIKEKTVYFQQMIQNYTDGAYELQNFSFKNQLFDFCVGKTVGGKCLEETQCRIIYICRLDLTETFALSSATYFPKPFRWWAAIFLFAWTANTNIQIVIKILIFKIKIKLNVWKNDFSVIIEGRILILYSRYKM